MRNKGEGEERQEKGDEYLLLCETHLASVGGRKGREERQGIEGREGRGGEGQEECGTKEREKED